MRKNIYFDNPYKRLFYDRIISTPAFSFLSFRTRLEWFNIFLQHLPLNLLMFFVMVATFAFGPGYNPIAFFFLPGILSLVAYARSAPIWSIPLLCFPAIAIGIFFAYAGSFSNGSPWDSSETIYMIPIALLFSALICVVLVVDRAIANFSLMLIHFIEIFFAFPMLWAGLWCLLAQLSPLGDFINWGYAIPLMGLDQLTLGATWLFGVIAGGAFGFGMMISSILYLTRRYLEIYHPDPIDPNADTSVARHQLISDTKDLRVFFLHPISFVVVIIGLVYGFGTIYSTFGPEADMFYQTPIAQWAPSRVQVSCLVDANLTTTEAHLQTTGTYSKIVMWSERSFSVTNESFFLQQALDVSSKYGVYLGLAYSVELPANETYTSRNMFSLIVPPKNSSDITSKSSVGFSYQKANTIPGVERTTEKGTQNIPFVDSPYGRIGAAIGFDYDFPSLKKAYNNKVAIMLHPVWNWGPTGPFHAQMNRLRSVENGFTTVRCASYGVSGVFDMFYRILTQQITLGQGDEFVYNLPILGRRWTLFRLLSDYLSVICMAVFCFWLVFLTIFQLRAFYVQRNPRIRADESQII